MQISSGEISLVYYNPDKTVAIIPKSHYKEDCKGKSDISWGPNIVVVGPITCDMLWSSVLSWARCNERRDPEHCNVFRSTMSQQHSCNKPNDHMPQISKPKMEWDRNKTYYKAIPNWASLLKELKRLKKRIFKHKLKQLFTKPFLNVVSSSIFNPNSNFKP